MRELLVLLIGMGIFCGLVFFVFTLARHLTVKRIGRCPKCGEPYTIASGKRVHVCVVPWR